MKPILKTFTATAAALLTSISCVHEYPVNGGVDPTLSDIRISLTTTPTFMEDAAVQDEGLDHLYFVVEFHKDDFGPSPVIRREVGKAKDGDNSATIELHEQLPSGKYRCVAYAVAAGDTDGSESIFQLDDLSDIGFEDDYPGNTHAKECYESRFDMSLSFEEWNQSIELAQQMTSPMGGVKIISTDAEDFIKHEMNRLQLTSSGTGTSSWQWENYYVIWKYDFYYPVRYNAYTGLPNKAETEVSFRAGIVPHTDTDVSLGFDYIFVNGDASKVNVTLEVYDKDNTLLNTYSGIEIPLERGKMTTIEGEYLTRRKDQGIGIDPGFEGDINITLPD